MTRQRFLHCDSPNCPWEAQHKFSDWVRIALPEPKTGYWVSDLDFILYNYKNKQLMLLEVKTHNRECKFFQKEIFTNLSKWIVKGIDDDWNFLGFHIVKFEGTFFNDGKCYFDGKEIKEIDLKTELSFI